MKRLITILFVIIFGSAFAQQNPMFTQYMFNGVAINPAYAGSHDVLSAIAMYRNQWVVVEGAPKTTTFTLDAQLPNEKVGLAVAVINDKIGVTSDFGLYSAYAYRIKFPKATLALGVSAGVNQFVGDFSSISADIEAGTIDPSFGADMRALSPNFGAGIYYYSQKYYVGVSIPELLKNNPFGKQNDVEEFRSFKHYFITGGYLINATKDIKIRPSFLCKVVSSARIEWDLNVNVWFFNRMAIGATYRTFDSVDLLLELMLTRQISLGYAYDYPLTSVRHVSTGSHEFMLRYDFKFDKKKVITPRYF